MSRRNPDTEIITNGTNSIDLLAGLALLSVSLFYGFRINPEPLVIVLGVFSIVIISQGLRYQIRFSKTSFWARDRLLRWREFPFTNLTDMTFKGQDVIVLRFGKRRFAVDDSFVSMRGIPDKLREIGREQLPYFRYRLVEKSHFHKTQLCGCLDCISIIAGHGIKEWTPQKRVRVFGMPIGSKDEVAVCPVCGSSKIVTALDSKTPLESAAIELMRDHIQSGSVAFSIMKSTDPQP